VNVTLYCGLFHILITAICGMQVSLITWLLYSEVALTHCGPLHHVQEMWTVAGILPYTLSVLSVD
jgi:hypothetical protein